jgi:2',3'-cyclic-nucleotide 2'-phosphodiesterase (5'-nucleotidase family)
MKFNKVLAAAVAGAVFGMSAQAQGANRTGEVTLIHMGDLHGHLVPHASVRSDSAGKTEGGVARIYTLVEQIRRASPDLAGQHGRHPARRRQAPVYQG